MLQVLTKKIILATYINPFATKQFYRRVLTHTQNVCEDLTIRLFLGSMKFCATLKKCEY